jgi:hypothetical protein
MPLSPLGASVIHVIFAEPLRLRKTTTDPHNFFVPPPSPSMAMHPNAGHGLPILEVSRSRTTLGRTPSDE